MDGKRITGEQTITLPRTSEGYIAATLELPVIILSIISCRVFMKTQ